MNLTPIQHLELILPVKTVSEANRPNGEHWAKKRKRKKAQQDEVTVELSQALRGKFIRMPCKVTLTRMGPRELDEGDNLSSAFKAIRDAIARRLGVDDGDKSKIIFEYGQQPTRSRQYSIKISINSRLPTALVLED